MRKNLLLLVLLLGLGSFIGCSSPNPGSASLAAPEDFAATVGSATSVGLSWRKVDGATKYQIERKIADGVFAPLVEINHEVGGPFGQSHTDTGLSPNTRYTYRIRSANDSTRSDFVTAPEVQTPAAATTRYRVMGQWLGASDPNVYLITDSGVNYNAATVSINGVVLTYYPSPGSYRVSAIPGVTAGTVLNLTIAVPEGTITAQAAVPPAPTITAPAAGSSVPANTALTVSWTYSDPNPDRFHLHLLGNGPTNYVNAYIPGTERSFTIPADQVVRPAPDPNSDVFIYLRAVNDGKDSFTGPVLSTSEMGVATPTSITLKIGP